MTETRMRHRFAGIFKIVRFNVQLYALSAIILVGVSLLLASERLPHWLGLSVLCGAVAVMYWTLSSLLVSWYVYDYAGVTRWQWLPLQIPVPPLRWANIHAGLDESTSTLRQLFPGTEGFAVDIFDPGQMTEPSIARARRMHPSTEPFTPGRYDALPLSANQQDAVFLLFAAHELRAADQRTKLLRQTACAVREEGRVVLVEHLRDSMNFLAFGPGFFHFHSRRSWLHSIQNAGLLVEQESLATPFVHCFVLRRADA